MHSKHAKAATKEEKQRFERMAEIGCVACRMNKRIPLHPTEIHHLIDGNKRIGHSASVPLCQWHHRGVPPCELSSKKANQMFGPSLALNGRAFKEVFGNDSRLLEFTNALLGELYARS